MTEKKGRQSSSSTSSMFQNAPAVRPQGEVSVAQQFMSAVKNAVQSDAGVFTALLKPYYPAGMNDQDIMRSFWGGLLVYLGDKPHLWRCDPITVQRSALAAVQQGLDFLAPNEAHLVPYGNKATLIRGYKGLAKIARQDEKIKFIDMREVYANDRVEVVYGAEQGIQHYPAAFGTPKGKLVGFYAFADHESGKSFVEIMSVQEVVDHAKKHKPAGNGPFGDIIAKGADAENIIPYGLKTVLLRLGTRKLDLKKRAAEVFSEEQKIERTDDKKPARHSVVDVEGVQVPIAVPSMPEPEAPKTQAPPEEDDYNPSEEELAAERELAIEKQSSLPV